MASINQLFQTTDTVITTVPGYASSLYWRDDLGIGYLPSTGYEYGVQYWEHYTECSHSKFGERLTELRIEFTKNSGIDPSTLCDVGIGAGQFATMAKCKGTDVNPIAIQWLKDNNMLAENLSEFSAISMWDVIEHIDDPTELLSSITDIVLSTPVYADLPSCLKSKHFKPDEHIWYFTDSGVEHFMSLFGFTLRGKSDFETVLGRESILSYYFQKF
jgi:hypothetical protein